MIHLRSVAAAGLWLALSTSAGAQGTLADYQRGRDLQSKTRDLVVNAPGQATWIDAEHFWYSRTVRGGTEYILVNANRTRIQRPRIDGMRCRRIPGRGGRPESLPSMLMELTR
jgi:hypothetical protein